MTKHDQTALDLGRSIIQLLAAFEAADIQGSIQLASGSSAGDLAWKAATADASIIHAIDETLEVPWPETDDPTDELDFDPDWAPGTTMNSAAALVSSQYDAEMDDEGEEEDEWQHPRDRTKTQRDRAAQALTAAIERKKKKPEKKPEKKGKKKKGKGKGKEAWFQARLAFAGVAPGSRRAREQRKQCIDAGIDLHKGPGPRLPAPRGKFGRGRTPGAGPREG